MVTNTENDLSLDAVVGFEMVDPIRITSVTRSAMITTLWGEPEN